MAILSHTHSHDHAHSEIPTSVEGIKILKWSSALLILTAMFQCSVVYYSGSVALLADTIHNFADALTSVPLWIAFRFARLKPTPQFTYGYGRVEDLAGVAIVFIVLFSAVAAGYESVHRFFHPQEVSHLGAIFVAGLIGFLGNELVAIWRIRTGKKIGSVAMIADGHHARVDGWTSLAVLIGAIGVYLGYPIVDALVGFGITFTLLGIVLQSGKSIFIRLLDGIDPHLIHDIRHAVEHVKEVQTISTIRARWSGHKLTIDIHVSLDPNLTMSDSYKISETIRHHIYTHLPHVERVHVLFDAN